MWQRGVHPIDERRHLRKLVYVPPPTVPTEQNAINSLITNENKSTTRVRKTPPIRIPRSPSTRLTSKKQSQQQVKQVEVLHNETKPTRVDGVTGHLETKRSALVGSPRTTAAVTSSFGHKLPAQHPLRTRINENIKIGRNREWRAKSDKAITHKDELQAAVIRRAQENLLRQEEFSSWSPPHYARYTVNISVPKHTQTPSAKDADPNNEFQRMIQKRQRPSSTITEEQTELVKPSALLILQGNRQHPVRTPSRGKPEGVSEKPLNQWSVTDVSDWLKNLGLEVYMCTFVENEISGSHLSLLGKDELIYLGVKPLGHRLTILSSLNKLRQKMEEENN